MPTFNITRIHTDNGIFRLKGSTIKDTTSPQEPLQLHIEHLDILGTDGWITLDIKNADTQTLIKTIHGVCLHHLQHKY